jgi:tetratricopeptide (TPR) repeat protein
VTGAGIPRAHPGGAGGAGGARWAAPALVALATAVVFLPALRADFINYDDPENFLENPHFRGLGRANLRWMLLFHSGNYQPLTWVTHAVDYLLWGMDPRGHHLTSVLVHVATALAVYLAIIALVRAAVEGPGAAADEPGLRRAAAAGALVFAIHPLRVESVAWVTERRDVLSGLFFVLTVVAYLRAQRLAAVGRARGPWIGLSIVCLVLSLLSKAWAMTMPVVLLLLDVHPLRRFVRVGGRRPPWGPILAEKIPFAVIALAGAVVAFAAQREFMPALEPHPVPARLAQAAYGLAFYVRKTLVPVGLYPYYELRLPLDPTAPRFVAAAAAVGAITLVLVVLRRRWPAGLVAWCGYGVIVSPVLGLAQAGIHLAADRFTYVATMPLAALAGGGVYALWTRAAAPWVSAGARVGAAAPVIALLAALGVATFAQVRVWRDSVTLWSHAVTVAPDNAVVHQNLGVALKEAGRLEEAIGHLAQASALRPDWVEARLSLAGALATARRYERAIAELQQIVAAHPDHGDALYSLGVASFLLGRTADAIGYYQRAIAANPDDVRAYYNLGHVYAQEGNAFAAAAQWEKAVALAPDNVAVRNAFGVVLVTLDRPAVAEEQFRAALRVAPDDPDSLSNLGLALDRQGKRAEAVELWRRVLRLDPSHARARANLEHATAGAPPAP